MQNCKILEITLETKSASCFQVSILLQFEHVLYQLITFFINFIACVCKCLVSSSRHYLEGASVKPAEGGFHGVGPGDAEVPPDRHARRALPLTLHAERARAQCECG